MKITVSEHNGKGSDDYRYSRTGVRCSYAGLGDPGAPLGYPKLLAAHEWHRGFDLAIPGNSRLNVNGDMIVNSTSNPAVTRKAPDLQLQSLEIVSRGTSAAARRSNGAAHPGPDPFAGLPSPTRPVGRFADGNPAHGPGLYRGAPSRSRTG